jgi:hypothetical protein
MKYKVNDVLFSPYGSKNQKGRLVLEVEPRAGMWEMPFYKFESKESKSGFVWTPEWMLYTEEEFLREVKSGTLFDMTCWLSVTK